MEVLKNSELYYEKNFFYIWVKNKYSTPVFSFFCWGLLQIDTVVQNNINNIIL